MSAAASCRFVDNYLRMVHACAERDRQQVVDMSVQLGFLTGGLTVLLLHCYLLSLSCYVTGSRWWT
jgi:hypothetical protein